MKIRASQRNGCGFCLKMQAGEAITHGESWECLAVLPAWWESQYFMAEEQSALQIVEQVTLISDHAVRVDREVHPETHLTDVQISAVTWLTVVINS